MDEIIARIQGGDITAAERGALAELVVAMTLLADAEAAEKRLAAAQTSNALRVTEARSQVDAQLALLLTGPTS